MENNENGARGRYASEKPNNSTGAPWYRRLWRAVQRGLIWLSGAQMEEFEGSEKENRAPLPLWEKRKYEAMGATVLVPAIFGMVGASYAVSTLTDNLWIAAGFALIWGFIILVIDRALLTTYRAFASPFTKCSQFVLRFAIAFLLGFTIAHPMTLLVFRDTIDTEVERERAGEIQDARLLAEENKNRIEERIAETAAAVAVQQQKYQETISASFMEKKDQSVGSEPAVIKPSGRAALEEQVAQATTAQKSRIAELDREIGQHSERYLAAQQELGSWQEQYEAEINGTRSGAAGVGPRARSVEQDQLKPRRDEAARLGSLMQSLTGQRNQLGDDIVAAEKRIRDEYAGAVAADSARVREDQQQVAALQRELQKQQLSIFVDQQDALLAQVQAQIDSHSQELMRLRAEATQMAQDAQSEVEMLQSQRRGDLLTQTLALHRLFVKGEEGGKFALIVYVVLALLFMVVDTIPIVVKFFSAPGPYDLKLMLGPKQIPWSRAKRGGGVSGEGEEETEIDWAKRDKRFAVIDNYVALSKRLEEAECEMRVAEGRVAHPIERIENQLEYLKRLAEIERERRVAEEKAKEPRDLIDDYVDLSNRLKEAERTTEVAEGKASLPFERIDRHVALSKRVAEAKRELEHTNGNGKTPGVNGGPGSPHASGVGRNGGKGAAAASEDGHPGEGKGSRPWPASHSETAVGNPESSPPPEPESQNDADAGLAFSAREAHDNAEKPWVSSKDQEDLAVKASREIADSREYIQPDLLDRR